MTLNRLFSRILLASLATVAIGAGCYNPKIKPGGLRCNTIYEEECPEGHYCLNGFCQKTGAPVVIVDSGMDLAVDKTDGSVDKGVDKPGVDAQPEVPGMCYEPVAGCTPAAGTCDPQCQTGCKCREKCSVANVNGTGMLTCNPLGQGAVKKEWAGCDINSENLPTQSDNCEPGLICVREACSAICVRFCRTNADCLNALCNRTLPGGVKACSLPTSDCNPVKAAGPTGCPGMIQGCYLSVTAKDVKTCDCSIIEPLREGGSCNVSRDCYAGLVCADAGGSGLDLRCRIACSMVPISGVANGGCPVGYTCRSHLGSDKYGYCI